MLAPAGGDDWTALGSEPLPVAEAMAWATRPADGAVVCFTGTVRNASDGRAGVTSLTYEAYADRAAERFGAVAAEARRRWPAIGRVALLHRLGMVELGEVSVAVVVSSPHRPDAFEAGRFCIDALKETAPIWKSEAWEGGTDWSATARPVGRLPGRQHCRDDNPDGS